MDYTMHTSQAGDIAELTSINTPISSASDFLDLSANIRARSFIIRKEMLTEDFFDLKTGLAGEILQKCSNYSLRLAIIGDYSGLSSKSLKDFMYECNSTNQIIFVPSAEEALKRFSG